MLPQVTTSVATPLVTGLETTAPPSILKKTWPLTGNPGAPSPVAAIVAVYVTVWLKATVVAPLIVVDVVSWCSVTLYCVAMLLPKSPRVSSPLKVALTV